MYNASENLNISSSEKKAKIGEVFNVVFEVLCPTCGEAIPNPYSETHTWSTYDLGKFYGLGSGDTVRVDCDNRDRDHGADWRTVRVKIPGRFSL